MEVPEIGLIRFMNPVDVLDSRIQNLALIPAKRTPAGVSQARLAIDVARAFLAEEIRQRGEKSALKLLERVVEIAREIGAVRVYLEYGVDPLQAIPLEDFRTTPALHSRRWPQILREIGRQREKIRRLRLQTRRTRRS